jgi:hypothetical protein
MLTIRRFIISFLLNRHDCTLLRGREANIFGYCTMTDNKKWNIIDKNNERSSNNKKCHYQPTDNNIRTKQPIAVPEIVAMCGGGIGEERKRNDAEDEGDIEKRIWKGRYCQVFHAVTTIT